MRATLESTQVSIRSSDPTRFKPSPKPGRHDVTIKTFEMIRNSLDRVVSRNLLKATVVVFSGYWMGVKVGILTANVFGVFKLARVVLSGITSVEVHAKTSFPLGSLRSRYTQETIHEHQYAKTSQEATLPELQAALQGPIPREQTETSCAITLEIVRHFFTHGFKDLTPFELDALLAKGRRLDAFVREKVVGVRQVNIYQLFENLPADEFPNATSYPDIHPIEALLSQNLEQNKVVFLSLLKLIDETSPAASICAILFVRDHYTGIYLERDSQGGIERIYVSESRSTFPNGVDYDSGEFKGAILACLGNTVEEASSRLAAYYQVKEPIIMYMVERAEP